MPVTTAWWVAKPFWVMGMGILPTREVRVALMEYVAAAYDAQMTDDEALRTGIAMPLPWNVPAPTNLVLTTGTTEPAIRASWTAAPDARIARYEVQGQRSGDPNWREFGYVTADTLSAIIAPVSDGENWTVQVRALTAAGIHSEWLSAIHTVSLIGGSLFTYTVSADASSVTYALTYGVNCALMELYTIQHEASGGANPTLTPADLAASMPRPASGLFTQRVATKANYYRRTRIVSYNAAGAPGQDSGVIETQAVTTGGPPSAPPNTLAKVSATGTTLTISWVNGDAAAVTRIYLDGVVIYPAPAGQTGYTIQGLSPSHTYQVDADHFKNGQASTKNGAVAMTTAAVTLDAPVGFAANGIMGPPIYMGFGWAMGANAEGATTSMQESAIGDFSDAVPVADASPTPPGATTATSAQHTSGSYSFRAKHQRPDSTDSGWSNVVIATYGGAAE